MFSTEIRISLEKQLGDELFSTLEGDILNDILSEGKIESNQLNYQAFLDGHSFKALPNLAPGIFGIFQEVIETLEFNEPVEFYINNSPELNAFAVASTDDGQPHIINLNSGLVEMLTDRELRFVVGHEIGHIISRNANISKLIRFVFPDPSRVPLLLQHKIALWDKLAELTADRYGFLANPDMESCISGFFKISSGLNAARIGFDFNEYLGQNEEVLARFRENGAGNLMSHPVNPIRIKAIQLFAGSALFASLLNEQKPVADEALASSIEELTQSLMVISSTPLDMYRRQFIATAGIIMANIDEKMNEDEYENILRILSGYTIFPAEYLNQIFKSGKVGELFGEAIEKILEMNPGDRYSMFNMMINIAHSDNRLARTEIALLFDVGTKALGMSRREVAQLIAENVQRNFMPEIYVRD